MAEESVWAPMAFRHFIQTYHTKDPKAVACLEKDRDALPAFYDFPAEHWIHVGTTNPIESTLATTGHRTERGKGCLGRDTMLAMISFLLIIYYDPQRIEDRNQNLTWLLS